MAGALSDEWTEEKCLQLVRAFRTKPILWDQRDQFFFKKNLKPLAWNEISELINIPAATCKHKMAVLMSSFRREKAKIMNSIQNGDPSTAYRSTWFGFRDMSFLLDKEAERKRQAADETGEVIEDDQPYIIKPSASRLSQATHVKKHFRTLFANRRLLKRSLEDGNVSPATPGHSAPTTTETEDEIKFFTSFIGTKMRRYSDSTKNAVQQAICEIIFKADQNYYEKNVYENEHDPLTSQEEEGDDMIIIKQDQSDTD